MMLSFIRSGKFKNIFWEPHVCFEEKKTKVDRNWSKITKKDKVAAEEDEWNVTIYRQENFWGEIPTLPILLIVKAECRS